ncbi:hypothetical protein [Hyphomicrobium sp. 1Nfss2.1]|uniref:hypothetical protein n=1 Tax=Hyphomicrobium sp. 1Nfss2.1 TaxID=3413936 RepID=UPI003C7E041A
MSTFTVRRGHRYRAEISLGVLESLAGNEAVAARLRDAGFADVSVAGAGRKRIAEGLWPNADASAALPHQITAVTEIEAA